MAVLAGEMRVPPPLWMMRQAGRYLPEYRDVRSRFPAFLDLCYSPCWAAEVTLQPIRRFGLDAAILFSDILVVPHALGQAVRFEAGEGPKLDAIGDAAGIARLDVRGVGEHLAPVLETVERVRSGLDGDIALLGFCGAPWTVATYMVQGGASADQRAARVWALRDPEEFSRLIDILVESSIGYLCGQLGAGADAVQIFDTWAGVLGEAEFERWVIAPTRRIVEGVRGRIPDARIIGFPRGAGLQTVRYAQETGVDALGLDWTVPLAFARDELQDLLPIQGNLDPLALLAGGRALDAGVDAILEMLGAGPLVFNLGHGILPETPIAHVERLVARVRAAG